MTKQAVEKLAELAGKEQVHPDEPMSRHTTFRIGGPADCLVIPENEEILYQVLSFCREEDIPYYVMGNGSNLLVSDEGFRGVVIQLYRGLQSMVIEGNRIIASSGVLLSAIARAALTEGSLGGMEFAAGIPGTLGGAAVMNAGAYGGEMKDIIRMVRVLDETLTVREIPGQEMAFGYRTSIVKEKNYIVLGAEIELQEGDPQKISERMEELRQQRISKQPLDLPSAGSTFKRPAGYFAGKLIMDAGLRGYRVGGARVSEKHCGFVVNTGGATAADVDRLMHDVQDKVFEQFGVLLEPEVRKLGRFA